MALGLYIGIWAWFLGCVSVCLPLLGSGDCLCLLSVAGLLSIGSLLVFWLCKHVCVAVAFPRKGTRSKARPVSI